MDKKYLIALAVVVALVSYQLYVMYWEVEPEVITGHWVMYEEAVGAEDSTVTGYWMFKLTVDTRDEIAFTFTPDNMVTPLEADLDAGIPPGSEIRTEVTISAIFEPHGPPYISGPVGLRGYVYDDSSWPGNEDRAWRYYALGYPEWHVDGRHAPYDITIEEDGIPIFGPQTYISGIREGWDTGIWIQLPYGMSVYQFGQLTNGLVLPTDQYAYIWASTNIDLPPSTHLVKLYDLELAIVNATAGHWPLGCLEDRADKWDEACGIGINCLGDRVGLGILDYDGRLKLSEQPTILADFLEPVYYPTGIITRWTQSAGTLYQDTVPKDDEVGWDDLHWEFGWDTTNYTAIRALPHASVMAELLLKVPADVFDSWVYRPPYGNPEIIDVVTPIATDGQRNIISFNVLNEGPTGDTFVANLIYPEVQIEQGPGRVYIAAGETGRFQFIISKPETGLDEYTLSGYVTVTAIGSNLSDRADFTQTWRGGGNPQPGYGSIMGTVVDVHNNPVERARVYCGGKVAFTDYGTGMFAIMDIAAGSQLLTIDAGDQGYRVLKTDVTVMQDEMVDVGVFVLTEIGAGSIWPYIALAVVMVVVILAFIYWYRKKKKGGK